MTPVYSMLESGGLFGGMLSVDPETGMEKLTDPCHFVINSGMTSVTNALPFQKLGDSVLLDGTPLIIPITPMNADTLSAYTDWKEGLPT